MILLNGKNIVSPLANRPNYALLNWRNKEAKITLVWKLFHIDPIQVNYITIHLLEQLKKKEVNWRKKEI